MTYHPSIPVHQQFRQIDLKIAHGRGLCFGGMPNLPNLVVAETLPSFSSQFVRQHHEQILGNGTGLPFFQDAAYQNRTQQASSFFAANVTFPQSQLPPQQCCYAQNEPQSTAPSNLADWTRPSPTTAHPQGAAGVGGHTLPFEVPSADSAQKTAFRRLKNRQAAKECRQRKKEYVKCLEKRVVMLEDQNKTLIEELRTLKVIFRVKIP